MNLHNRCFQRCEEDIPASPGQSSCRCAHRRSAQRGRPVLRIHSAEDSTPFIPAMNRCAFFQMNMGQHSRRQIEASRRHDAANALASQIATGTRAVEAVGDNKWTIAAAVGDAIYCITRQGCKRICMVGYSLARLVQISLFRSPASAVASAPTSSYAIVPTHFATPGHASIHICWRCCSGVETPMIR
jgi:hypothetical protein